VAAGAVPALIVIALDHVCSTGREVRDELKVPATGVHSPHFVFEGVRGATKRFLFKTLSPADRAMSRLNQRSAPIKKALPLTF